MRKLEYFKKLYEEDDITDLTGDETSDDTDEKTDKEDKDDPSEEEESNEEEFVNLFSDSSFVDAFKSNLKQYISEKILEDEYNSFTIIPLLEINFKDESYNISIEFESAVTINVNEDGKVIEKDLPDVELIKYKTPVMDNITLLDNEIGKETISLYVKEAIDEIKQVPR